jgi:subtilisin family serine protease
VKVALLDTGIDLKHSYFEGEYPSGRVKSVRSWVDGKEGAEDGDGGDESGHGTFIASLLLDLCPTIDLYIARISKSRNFKKGTSVNVVNVSHSRSRRVFIHRRLT